MPTKTPNIETVLRTRWMERGLTAQQADDLIAIAHELATVTGKPIGSCLDDVHQRVLETLEGRLLTRINETITYGSNLERKPY